MKKLYELPWSRYARPWLAVLSLVLLTYVNSTAQNIIFSEKMSQVYAGDNIDDDEANNYFDEPTLTYSGTGIGGDRTVANIPQNTAANSSNLTNVDGYIILGNLSGSTATSTATEKTFVIGDILGPINNPTLTFYLYIGGMRMEQVSATNSNLVLEASTDGGTTYSTVTYSRADGATSSTRGGWIAFTTSALPVTSSLQIRFRKVTGINALYAIDDVQLTGVRNNISVSATTLNFGNINVNTQSTAKQIRVAGANLADDIIVTAPDGFLVRKGTEAYSISTKLPRNSNGVVDNTAVDVIFAPTAAKTYSTNSDLSVTSVGSAAMSVQLNGTGVTPPPATVAAPSSITFPGSTAVGQFSTPIDFKVSGSNLVSNVTVTPPAANYQIRVGTTGAFTSNPITLTPTNGTLAETTLQVRFVPISSGTINSSIRVSATNAGEQAIAVSGTATPAPAGPTVNANPTDLVFGTASGSGSSTVLTFDVSGTNLTEALVLTPSNSNIVIRDQAAGGDFVNTPLSFSPVNGTVSIHTIEVKLIGPLTGNQNGQFSGYISVGSGTALPKAVNVTASPVLNGSSTINTEGSLTVFEAVPNNPSASQSYIITGTNLLQRVQIEAPLYFQISLNDDFSSIVGTGNKLFIPLNSGNDLTRTPIYIRYFPTGAQTVSSSILHNSDPARQVSLSVTGTSEPSIVLEQAYSSDEKVVIGTTGKVKSIMLTGKRVNQDVTISLVQSANDANPSNTQQFQLSLDNANFSNTLVVTPDAQKRSISRPIYIRYAPTYLGGDNGASARFQFQSNDFSDNKEPQFFTVNSSLAGWSIDTRPTKKAPVTITRNNSTALITFDLPNDYVAQGYGEGRIVIASEQNALTQLPANGVPYTTGNQKYGEKEFTGAPGYFVVFSGDNAQATIESLNPQKTYYFYTFEYNNVAPIKGRLTSVQTAENYLTPATPDAVRGIASPGNPTVLPVELTAFTATLRNAKVSLAWSTASEKNSKGFEVQRSQNGKDFATLQFVAGQGTTSSTTNYAAVDAQPFGGTSYYRLKQVDHDGTFAYSPVAVIINGSVPASEVSLYPNPAQDVVTVALGQLPAAGARVTVADMMGRVVLSDQLSVNGELSVARLQAGTYIVTVETTGGQKISRKLVKTN